MGLMHVHGSLVDSARGTLGGFLSSWSKIIDHRSDSCKYTRYSRVTDKISDATCYWHLEFLSGNKRHGIKPLFRALHPTYGTHQTARDPVILLLFLW